MRDELATVPVIIDAYPRGSRDALARCVYFTIVVDEPRPGWTLQLRDGNLLPFFMIGLQGIIHRPIPPNEPTFRNWHLFEELVRAVEKVEEVSVDTEYLWLPTSILDSAWYHKQRSREQPPRGSVFRLSRELFGHAFSAARDGHGFLALADIDRSGDGLAITYSREESAAIRQWSALQVEVHARFRARGDGDSLT